MMQAPDLSPLITYPRDALLTKQEVARALRVSVDAVERADLPTVYVTPRTPRYIWGLVLDTLASRAA